MTVSDVLEFVLDVHVRMCQYLSPMYYLVGAVFLLFALGLFVRSVFYGV